MIQLQLPYYDIPTEAINSVHLGGLECFRMKVEYLLYHCQHQLSHPDNLN